MGFRFRRSFKIAPGVRLNVGKKGLSTTIGVRGASINIGQRGTYVNAGVPGTGLSGLSRNYSDGRAGDIPRQSSIYSSPDLQDRALSYREKIAGGGAAPGPGDPTAGSTQSGCMGCGCIGMLGFILLVMVAGMFSDDESAINPEPYGGNTLYAADTAAAAIQEDFYVHSAMNVRSGPGEEHPVLWTMKHGERIRLGPKDANGWAAVFLPGGTGVPAGYLYRASDQVRSYAPQAASSTPRRATSGSSARSAGRRSSAADRGYYTGPRGGCYTYSASGRKRYVDRSLCN
jgi:hypothetical protein